MLDRGVNAPVTTSAGRLFDAVAALAGLRQRSSYEGQAAMELEWAADGSRPDAAYPFAVSADGRAERAGRPRLGAGAHRGRWPTYARACRRRASPPLPRGWRLTVADGGRSGSGSRPVVLTGGCFQNARLTEAAIAALAPTD